MHTRDRNPTVPCPGLSSKEKILQLNGRAAIQSFLLHAKEEGDLFVQEDKLVFITQGCLTIRHGNRSYEARENQLVFLRKNIAIQYIASRSGEVRERNELIMFSLYDELIREFSKLVALQRKECLELSPISVSIVDEPLFRYIDSIVDYFAAPEKIESSLIKNKVTGIAILPDKERQPYPRTTASGKGTFSGKHYSDRRRELLEFYVTQPASLALWTKPIKFQTRFFGHLQHAPLAVDPEQTTQKSPGLAAVHHDECHHHLL